MAKRVVAALLCAAMVFSSESFSMAVMAAPVTAEEYAESGEEQAAEESAGQTAEIISEDESQQAEEAAASDEAAEVAAPDETISEGDGSDQTASEDATDQDATEQDQTGQDGNHDGNTGDGSEETSEQTPDQEPVADDGAAEEAEIPETDEVIPYETAEADEGETPAPASFFKVDAETGELQIDNETAFPENGKVEIPKEAKKIPAGIFNAEAYADKIREVTFEEGSLLESIGENAFQGSKIEKFESASVTEIGDSAFENCENLAAVDMPALVTVGKAAFRKCQKLDTGFQWPAGLKAIGDSAFAGCGFITLDMSGITAEDVVIGTGAFDSCVSLVAVTVLPAHLKTVPAMFRKCDKLEKVVLPDEVTELGEAAFEDVQVKEITIPAGVTSIGTAVFKNAKSLTKVTFNGTVTSIGKEAFQNTSITGIDASALTEVGQAAFAGCGNLSTLKSTATIETIGAYAFRGCAALVDFTWCPKLKSIGREAFAGCKFTELALGVIESEEIAIDSGAFSGCLSLEKVKSFPAHLTVISASMFKGCEKLSDVKLSGNVTAIQADAFADCKAISTVILPENVSIIRAGAFAGCTGLKTVTIQNPAPEGEAFILEDGAFPKVTPDKCTMKGYGGKVEIFAEKNGYKYESLFRSYSVSYDKDLAKNVEVTLSHEKDVTPGTDVTVTFKPKQGYTLMEGSVELYCDHISPQPEAALLSFTSTTILYRFKMPGDDVKVSFDVKKLEDAVAGTISASVRPKLTEENGVLLFDKAGEEAQIEVRDENARKVGVWLLDFKSSEPGAISVSDKGTLLSKRKTTGSVTITVSQKGKASNAVSFKMGVKESTKIVTLELDDLKAKNPLSLRRAVVTKELIGDAEYTVLQFDTSTLAKASVSFDVSFKAYEDPKANSYILPSEWKSTDTEVAALDAAKSENNSNRITVKKGADGQSLITFSVKNDGSKDPVTGKLLIRVVDATPRLAEAKLTVNTASSTGTPMDIVFVHGFDIRQGTDLDVYKKSVKNGTETYSPYEGLAVDYHYADGKYYLRATSALSLGKGSTLRYKGNKRLYLRGIFSNGSEFFIPIPDLSITRKSLKPTIKTSGKVNLFIVGKDDNNTGMTLTQSLDDEVVEIRLLSEANYKKEIKNQSLGDDPFSNNFMITPVDNKTYTVTWTGNELARNKNSKPVNTGYVAIKYKGNETYIYKKIKVSTEEKALPYELSMTAATANVNSAGQTYALQVLDKKTGNVLNLGSATDLYLSESESSPGLFNNISVSSIEPDKNGVRSVIPLTLSGAAADGKAVIALKLRSWSYAVKFTFQLKITSELPKAELTKPTITLNTQYPALTVTSRPTLNIKPEEKDYVSVYLDRSGLEYVEAGSTGTGAADIMNSMTFNSDGSITAKLPENAATGTYNYKVTPYVQYGASSVALAPIAFKVVVTDAKPDVSVRRSKVLEDGTIVYETVVKNAGAAIESIDIYEEIENGKPYMSGGRRIAPHYAVDFDKDTDYVYVRTKCDETGCSRNAILCYKLKEIGDAEVRINLEPEQKQKLPKKMTAKALGSYIYVGQNKSRSIQVQLATSDTKLKNVQFAAPAFGAGTSKAIRNAFRATVDPATGIMTLTLVDSSALVLNKKYTITFTNRYLGQASFVKGQKFKVSVTIRK